MLPNGVLLTGSPRLTNGSDINVAEVASWEAVGALQDREVRQPFPLSFEL